jgi:hypothetical protein
LYLPLQVSAVILNAVKDPEEFHPPQPLEPFRSGEIRSLPCPSRAAPTAHLHLHLPLQVSAVILNAVKDPEEFHSLQSLGPFRTIVTGLLPSP